MTLIDDMINGIFGSNEPEPPNLKFPRTGKPIDPKIKTHIPKFDPITGKIIDENENIENNAGHPINLENDENHEEPSGKPSSTPDPNVGPKRDIRDIPGTDNPTGMPTGMPNGMPTVQSETATLPFKVEPIQLPLAALNKSNIQLTPNDFETGTQSLRDKAVISEFKTDMNNNPLGHIRSIDDQIKYYNANITQREEIMPSYRLNTKILKQHNRLETRDSTKMPLFSKTVLNDTLKLIKKQPHYIEIPPRRNYRRDMHRFRVDMHHV